MKSCNPRATFQEVSISLRELKRIFRVQFDQLEMQGYFRQELARTRTDTGFVPGPVQSPLVECSEEDLFMMIKFLYDHVSKPIKHRLHRRTGFGRQCSEFDRDAGRTRYRQTINEALRVYNRGFELLQSGDIIARVPTSVAGQSGGSRLIADYPSAGLRQTVAAPVQRQRIQSSHDRPGVVVVPETAV